MLHLGRVIGRHGIKIHCYADKTQLKVTSTSSPSSSVSQLHSCLEETKAGLKENFLQLISSKTEAIQIGTPHQRRSSMISAVSFLGHYLSLSVSVTNLGVRFDPHQSFDSHINRICSTFFFHLRKSPNSSQFSPVILCVILPCPEPSQASCTFYTCPGLSLRLWATGLVQLLLSRLSSLTNSGPHRPWMLLKRTKSFHWLIFVWLILSDLIDFSWIVSVLCTVYFAICPQIENAFNSILIVINFRNISSI